MLRRFSPHRLIELRKAAGKSRDDLARDADCSWWSVQGWELGDSEPSARLLAAIGDALDCSLDDLFEDAHAA